jgi:uncharacterized RDD family membrane protein YckC
MEMANGTLRHRCLSSIVDSLILVCMYFFAICFLALISAYLGYVDQSDDFLDKVFLSIGFFIILFYYLFFLKKNNATPGQRLFNLIVVNKDLTKEIKLQILLWRFFVLMIFNGFPLLLIVNYIYYLCSSKTILLQDLFTRTRVVYKDNLQK